MATPSLGLRNKPAKPKNQNPDSKTANRKTASKNSDPNSEPEKASKQRNQIQKRTRTIGVGPSKHRTSALQRIPLLSGGASPSLKVRAMEWHNFAEILFGLAAVITALKQGGKKK